MARRPVKCKREIKPDPVYNMEKVAKFINHLMRRGKKTVAMQIFYQAMDEINKKLDKENFKPINIKFNQEMEQRKLKREPLEDKAIQLWQKALENVSPVVEVVSKRIGGANYQIPKEVRDSRRVSLGMRWLIEAARNKKGKPMYLKLAEEIILAAKYQGEAIRKKENIHRMAEANRAFAHFA